MAMWAYRVRVTVLKTLGKPRRKCDGFVQFIGQCEF